MTDETTREPIVQLTDVSMKNDRGTYLFRDLNLTLQPGNSMVIVGGSGSGKTLLADLLVGLRFAESGEVKVFGYELKKRRKRAIRKVRQKTGGVGGPFGLVPSLTVAENITLPLVIAGERRKLQKERLTRMLGEFSLLKVAGQYPKSLTRVENSLVQFARAAIASQPLIIVDEPTAGLDARTYRRVSETLNRLALSGCSLIVLTSEDPKSDLPNSEIKQLVSGILQ